MNADFQPRADNRELPFNRELREPRENCLMHVIPVGANHHSPAYLRHGFHGDPNAACGRSQSHFSRQDAENAKKTRWQCCYPLRSWRLCARHNSLGLPHRFLCHSREGGNPVFFTTETRRPRRKHEAHQPTTAFQPQMNADERRFSTGNQIS